MNLLRRNKRSLDIDVVAIILGLLSIIALSVFCYVFHYTLLIPLFLIFLGIHLYFIQKSSPKLLTDLAFLLFLILLISHYFNANNYLAGISPFYMPIAAFSMLTMLLFNDLFLAFLISFAGSIIASLILGGSSGMLLIFIMSSLTGAYFVKGARRRGQIISAGLFVSVVNVFALILYYPSIAEITSHNFLITKLYPLAANGFIAAFIVGATLKIFEFLFDAITNYSLLELSDFNQPLLKRLILEAPGTYHHSLVVSNLSEAAADAIGANSLLARVGAYYHDIGKIMKPGYFTENQILGGNIHDKIEPSMSRLVIFNHVKEGIDIAKKYKLNHNIIDFIPQHHGTGIVYYFYQRALEEAREGVNIPEETYRYPGPKPQNSETAIVLLADSVEGATRALEDPNPTKIEETVKKVINNKFIDGQLDECNLTLNEINMISSVFTRILNATYHNRIRYPEKKNGVK